jgi:hypothetical protein
MNTCGRFSEVFILKDLGWDKTRQNTVKHGVFVDVENTGVAEFQVIENKKTPTGSWGHKLENEQLLEK